MTTNTDDTDNTLPFGAAAGTGAPIVGDTTPPAAGTAPAGQIPLENLTAEEQDALAARIAAARANRPPSVAQQLEALQRTLTETAGRKEQAVETRKSARDEADTLEAQLADIRATLRRTELVEAATAAGFKAPGMVADLFAGRDGDVTDLVKQAAGSGAFAMVTPTLSADVGGPGSVQPAGVDAGRAGLIAEIKAVQGR